MPINPVVAIGFSFFEDSGGPCARRPLQFHPAIGGVVRRIPDVAQQAAPLEDCAFDIPGAYGLGQKPVGTGSMFHDASNHLRGPGAVVTRDAKPEVSFEIGISECFLAAQGKAAQFPAVLRTEPRAAPEVSNIEEEVIDRISWIFDCGGDGESLTVLEERE